MSYNSIQTGFLLLIYISVNVLLWILRETRYRCYVNTLLLLRCNCVDLNDQKHFETRRLNSRALENKNTSSCTASVTHRR